MSALGLFLFVVGVLVLVAGMILHIPALMIAAILLLGAGDIYDTWPQNDGNGGA